MPSGRVSPSEAKSPILKSAQNNIRTGLEGDAIARALIENLHCLQGKLAQHATRYDWYMALAYTVRDRMMHRYMGTVQSISETITDAKAVAYLSAEFLTGPHLGNSLMNLGIWDGVDQAFSKGGRRAVRGFRPVLQQPTRSAHCSLGAPCDSDDLFMA